MRKQPSTARTLAGFEAASANLDHARYVLRLYVTGTTRNSERAIVNIRRICEEHLQGRYDLEVVDISEHPTLAQGEQIIAAPTLMAMGLRMPRKNSTWAPSSCAVRMPIHGKCVERS